MAGGNQVGGVPLSIGFPPPEVYTRQASQPQNPEELFKAILDVLKHLDGRLAPPRQMTQVKFGTVPAGTLIQVSLTTNYSAILNCLTVGTVDMFFSPPASNQGNLFTVDTLPPLDMQFNPAGNPLYCPFAERYEQQLGFVVDPGSQPAQGSLFVIHY